MAEDLRVDQLIQDPTSTGLQAIPGLNRKSAFDLPEEDLMNLQMEFNRFDLISRAVSGGDPKYISLRLRDATGTFDFIGNENVGDSRFDSKMDWASDFENLSENRGRLQSGAKLIGVGVLKGAVLAGTTFGDGLLGTWVGLGNLAAGGSFTRNPWSNLMLGVNEWSENALPSYYREHEQNSPWYTNIFTANFIGDKFLKNLGFAVGAAYAGRVNVGALTKISGLDKARKAFRGAVVETDNIRKVSTSNLMSGLSEGKYTLKPGALLDDLSKQASLINNRENALKFAGALSAGMGEARIEAVGGADEYIQRHKEILDREVEAEMASMANALMQSENAGAYFEVILGVDGLISMLLTPEARHALFLEIKPQYEEALARINKDASRAANAIFGVNTALLTASDWILFGKFYAGGHRMSRKAKNIAKDMTGQYTRKSSAVKDFARIAMNPFVEGTEEMMQSVAATGSGYMYDKETLLSAGSDPEANQNVKDFMSSMWRSMKDTWGDIDNYEEFGIGWLVGALGVPSARGLEGGILGERREIRARNREEQDLVDILNKSLTPEMRSYYKNLVRNEVYQRDMDEAADDGDSFLYKNAETSMLISNSIAYDKAGRLQDLHDIIDGFANIDPNNQEQIDSILRDTKDPKTGKSVYDGMTSQQIAESINNQAKHYKDLVNTYSKISQDLQIKAGKDFNSEGLDELTWMLTKVDDWEKRFKQMWSEVQTGLLDAGPILSEVEIDGIPLTQVMAQSPSAFLTHSLALRIQKAVEYESSKEEAKAYELRIKDKADKRGLAQMQEKLTRLKDAVTASENVFKEAKDITSKIDDMSKILSSRNDFLTKYNNYISNPESLTKKMSEVKAKAEDNQKKFDESNEKKSEIPTKEALKKASNMLEFKLILSGFNDPNLPPEASEFKRRKIADELSKEDHPLAMAYMDARNTNIAIGNKLGDLYDRPDADGVLKYSAQDLNYAKRILRDLYELSENGDDLRNASVDKLKVLSERTNEDGSLVYPNQAYRDAALEMLEIAIKENNDDLGILNSITKAIKKGKEALSKESKNPNKQKQNPNPVSKRDTPTVETPPAELQQQAPAQASEQAEQETEPLVIDGPVSMDKSSSLPVLGEGLSTQITLENKANQLSKAPLKKHKGLWKFWRLSFSQHSTGKIDSTGEAVETFKDPDFRGVEGLWNYLNDQGAWNYVNNGGVKLGDEVIFGIDPKATDYPGVNNIPVLVFHGDQVVGSLPSSETIELPNGKRYIPSDGLAELTQALMKVKQEYHDHLRDNPGDTGVFKSTIKTKVVEILPGRMPFEKGPLKPINLIPNINETKTPDGKSWPITFAYIKGGVYIAPNVNNADLDSGVLNAQNKEGMVFRRVIGGDGRVYPAHVLVKRFNNKEFDISQATTRSTLTYKMLELAFRDVLSSSSMLNELPSLSSDNSPANRRKRSLQVEKKVNALNVISDILYFPGDIYAELNNTPGGLALKINYRDSSGLDVGADFITVQRVPRKEFTITQDDKLEGGVVEEFARRSDNDIINEILQKTQERNFRFLVDGSLMNTPGYNERLVNDGLLVSNSTLPGLVSAWFKMAPVKSNGVMYTREEMDLLDAPNPLRRHTNNSPVGGVESVAPKLSVRFKPFSNSEETVYEIDSNGNIIGEIKHPIYRGLIEDLALIKLASLGMPVNGTSIYRTNDRKKIRLDNRGLVVWIRINSPADRKLDLSLRPIEYIGDPEAKSLEYQYQDANKPAPRAPLLNPIHSKSFNDNAGNIFTIEIEDTPKQKIARVWVNNSDILNTAEYPKEIPNDLIYAELSEEYLNQLGEEEILIPERKPQVEEVQDNILDITEQVLNEDTQDFLDILGGAGFDTNPEALTSENATPSISPPLSIHNPNMTFEEFKTVFKEHVARTGMTLEAWNLLTQKEKEHEINCAAPF